MFSIKEQIVNNLWFGRPHTVLVIMPFFFLSGVFQLLKYVRIMLAYRAIQKHGVVRLLVITCL